MGFGLIDPFTQSGTVDSPEDRDLLDFPEQEGRSHAGDGFLVTGAPPAASDAQVGDLIVGCGLDQGEVEDEGETDGCGQNPGAPGGCGFGRRRGHRAQGSGIVSRGRRRRLGLMRGLKNIFELVDEPGNGEGILERGSEVRFTREHAVEVEVQLFTHRGFHWESFIMDPVGMGPEDAVGHFEPCNSSFSVDLEPCGGEDTARFAPDGAMVAIDRDLSDRALA